MERKFNSNHNITYSCKYHVVWCPKYRRPVLVNGVDVRLNEILREVVGQTTGEILEMEIMPDHVQVLVDINPQFGICKLVRLMKGRSSRYLRQEFSWLKSRLPTLWTNSYFVATVGGAPLSAVKQYIQKQKNV